MIGRILILPLFENQLLQIFISKDTLILANIYRIHLLIVQILLFILQRLLRTRPVVDYLLLLFLALS